MKIVILLLCVLPILTQANLVTNLLNGDEIKKFVGDLVTKVGSDATEAECEKECVVVFTNALLDTACDTLCKGIQGLIHKFHH